MLISLFVPILILMISSKTLAALVESERAAEYYARNSTWPPKIVPDTPGWKRLMMERLEQVHEIDDLGRRYEGYIQAVHMAVSF
jgi:hypothetical protein